MLSRKRKLNMAVWSDASQHLSRKQRMVALVAGVLTGLVVIGAVVWFVGTLPEKTKAAAFTDAAADDAYSVAFNGDYDAAQRKLDTSATKAPTDKERARVYITQATLAYNAEKYEAAKAYALKAEQATPTDVTAAVLGDISVRMSNKAEAQTYYALALKRLDKDTQSYPGRLHSYQTKLAAARS